MSKLEFSDSTTSSRLLQTVSVGTYILLGYMAVLFYKERAIFLDISFHLFYILKDQTFAIQNFRFGAISTQLFPLIGSYFNLDLKTITILYSLGFVLFYFLIYLACDFFDKTKKYGLVMMLLSILMVSDTFYWIQSELPQGLALLVLFFCFSSQCKNKLLSLSVIHVLVYVILLFTLALIHPVIIAPFIFIAILFWVNNDMDRQILKLSTSLFLFFYIIKSKVLKTEYDTKSLEGLDNFYTLFPDYINLQSNFNFLTYLFQDYYMLILLLLVLIIGLVMTRKFVSLFITLCFFIAYLFLINISYPQGADQFYIENLYLPLSIFLIVPFVFYILPKLSRKWIIFVILTISIVRVSHIYNKHDLYTSRLDYLRKELKMHSSIKTVISETSDHKSNLIMTWATPYEFWLLSTIETGVTESLLILDQVSEVEWAVNRSDVFITKWGAFDYNQLPVRYFNFKNNSNYVIIRE